MSTKYEAFASSSKLLKSEDFPHSFLNNIVKTITNPDGANSYSDITNVVTSAPFTGLVGAVNKFRRYAESKSERGLPTSNIDGTYFPLDNLKRIMDTQLGISVTIVATTTGELTPEFIVDFFCDKYYTDHDYFNWDAGLGLPTSPVWEERRETIDIPELSNTGQYFTTENIPKWVRVGDPADPYRALYEVQFRYTNDKGNTNRYWKSAKTYDPSLDFQVDEPQYQIKYVDDADPHKTLYWTYVIGSGIKELDDAFVANGSKASFLPISTLIRDKVDYNDDTTSREYKDQNIMLKRLDMDGEEILEGIHEAQDDLKGNKSEFWDVYLHFAAPIRSKVSGTRRYLFEFFNYLGQNAAANWSEYQQYVHSRKNSSNIKYPKPMDAMTIQDGKDNRGYNSRVSWSCIEHRNYTGVFKDKTTNNKDLKIHEVTVEFHKGGKKKSPTYEARLTKFLNGAAYELRIKKKLWDDYFIVTRQTGHNTYERLLVMDLDLVYTINTKEVVSGGNQNERWRTANPSMFEQVENEDGGYEPMGKDFIIPIHIGILNKINVIKREDLLADSLHATIFIVVKTKIKWYQKSFFKFLIVIIAIIVTIWGTIFGGWGALAGQGILGLLAKAAIGYVIGMAAVIVFGPKWGGIVAMVIMFYMGGGFSGLKEGFANSWSGVTQSFGWNTALAMLNTVLPLIQNAFSLYQTHELDKINGDMREHIKSAKEKQDDLDNAWAGLTDMNNNIDALDIVRSPASLNAGEPVDVFYSRALETNPGVGSFAVIGRYVDAAVRLPEQINEGNSVSACIKDLENMFA